MSMAGNITNLMPFKIFDERRYSGTEFRFLAQQADDQPARLGHTEEVAGMDPDAALEQREDGELVGFKGRNTKHGIPAGFDRQAAYDWEAGELTIEFGEIGRDAPANLVLDSPALLEPEGRRPKSRRKLGQSDSEGLPDNVSFAQIGNLSVFRDLSI